jgi:hypothetical protein
MISKTAVSWQRISCGATASKVVGFEADKKVHGMMAKHISRKPTSTHQEVSTTDCKEDVTIANPLEHVI